MVKGGNADIDSGVGDLNILQRFAIGKGMVTDPLNRSRDMNSSQVDAIEARIVGDSCDRVGDGHGCKRGTYRQVG